MTATYRLMDTQHAREIEGMEDLVHFQTICMLLAKVLQETVFNMRDVRLTNILANRETDE